MLAHTRSTCCGSLRQKGFSTSFHWSWINTAGSLLRSPSGSLPLKSVTSEWPRSEGRKDLLLIGGLFAPEILEDYKTARAIAIAADGAYDPLLPDPQPPQNPLISSHQVQLKEIIVGLANEMVPNENRPASSNSPLLRNLLETMANHMERMNIVADEAPPPATLIDEMTSLRGRVDRFFGFQPNETSAEVKRAAALSAMLLFNEFHDVGRSELMIAKVFGLVAGSAYRSHEDILFHFQNGAWLKTGALKYSTLQTIISGLCVAEACFLLMYNLNIPRNFESVGFEIRFALNRFTLTELSEALLRAPGKKKRDMTPNDWPMRASLLCVEFRKAFNERTDFLITCFHKWGGSPLPDDAVGGVNFEDRRFYRPRSAPRIIVIPQCQSGTFH